MVVSDQILEKTMKKLLLALPLAGHYSSRQMEY
jgi:hypothetical protein